MSIVTLEDIRDEGVTEDMASDNKVNSYIAIWEPIFEEHCGQWFDPREMSVTFDGDNTSIMFFQVPIISVDSIEDLETAKELEASDYKAYTARTLAQDDRRNPKIALTKGLFYLGRQRWKVTGTFGFTEEDDSPPPAVKQAMLELIIEKLLTPKFLDADAILLPQLNQQLLGLGAKIEEITDSHKVKWQTNNTKMKGGALDELTRSSFVKHTIKQYRAPMNIKTQTLWEPCATYSESVFSEVFG